MSLKYESASEPLHISVKYVDPLPAGQAMIFDDPGVWASNN